MINIPAEWFIANLFFNTWIPPLCFGSNLLFRSFTLLSIINGNSPTTPRKEGGREVGSRLSSSVTHRRLQGAIKRRDGAVRSRREPRESNCHTSRSYSLNETWIHGPLTSNTYFPLQTRDSNIKTSPLRNDRSVGALLARRSGVHPNFWLLIE